MAQQGIDAIQPMSVERSREWVCSSVFVLDTGFPLSSKKTQSPVCWLTRSQRTPYLPKQDHTPGGERLYLLDQLKPPKFSEPGLSGTFLGRILPAHRKGPKLNPRRAVPQCSLPGLGPLNFSFPAGSSAFVPVLPPRHVGETPVHIWTYPPFQGVSSLLSPQFCSSGC